MQLIGLLSWIKTTTKNKQKTTACKADTAKPQEAEMVPWPMEPWPSPKNRITLGQKKDQQVEMLPLKLHCVAGEFYKDSPHQSPKHSRGATSPQHSFRAQPSCSYNRSVISALTFHSKIGFIHSLPSFLTPTSQCFLLLSLSTGKLVFLRSAEDSSNSTAQFPSAISAKPTLIQRNKSCLLSF